YRKNFWLEAEQLFAIVPHEIDHFIKIVRLAQKINFIERDDNFFAPRANTLALGEGAINGGDEQNEVAARDKLFGEPLMLAQNRIDSRRIDDADILQEVRRVGNFQYGLIA